MGTGLLLALSRLVFKSLQIGFGLIAGVGNFSVFAVDDKGGDGAQVILLGHRSVPTLDVHLDQGEVWVFLGEGLNLRTSLFARSSPIGEKIDDIHLVRNEHILDHEFAPRGGSVGVLDSTSIGRVCLGGATKETDRGYQDSDGFHFSSHFWILSCLSTLSKQSWSLSKPRSRTHQWI